MNWMAVNPEDVVELASFTRIKLVIAAGFSDALQLRHQSSYRYSFPKFNFKGFVAMC